MTRIADGTFVGSTQDGTLHNGSYDTTTPLEGDASVVLDPGENALIQGLVPVAGRDYFWKMLVRTSALPADDLILVQPQGPSGLNMHSLRLDTDGKLFMHSTTNKGATALQPGTTHVVELRIRPNSGTSQIEYEVRLDGEVEISTVTFSNSLMQEIIRFGQYNSTTSGITVTVDDWAYNDDQGATDNSWPYAPPVDTDAPVIDQVSLDFGVATTLDRVVNLGVVLETEDAEAFEMKVYGDVDPAVDANIQPLEVNATWVERPFTVLPPTPSQIIFSDFAITVSEGLGLKTVRVKVRDEALNESAEATDTIELVAPPTAELKLKQSGAWRS